MYIVHQVMSSRTNIVYTYFKSKIIIVNLSETFHYASSQSLKIHMISYTFIAKNQVENFNSNSEKVINSLLYATELNYQITNFSFYVVLCTLHFGMYFKKNISVISIYDLKMCICF